MDDNEVITEVERRLLQKYEAMRTSAGGYENIPHNGLVQLCRLKDKNNDLFVRRTEAARAVIDLIARKVGLDPENYGLCLYYLDGDYEDSSPIVRKLDEWLDRSGDKVQLKRRIQELENENRVLRSVIGKP